MKRTSKPVRNCHGCGLNFGDFCGVYECPHDMWHDKKKCPGYMNEEMLNQYLAERERLQADEAKRRRQLLAKRRDTKDHHDGTRHANGTLVIK